MNNLIFNAISNKELLSFYYGGGNRIVEPHCYGINTAGHEVLCAYQVSGFSKSGAKPPWRSFQVSKMSAIMATEEHFTGARRGYRRGDSRMTRIFTQL